MKIIITLICHNRPEYLRQVLASIQANVYHGMSLIVARDNASDEVNAVIDEIDWIQKTVFDTNLGINYANQFAYRHAILAGADYVVAVEDDTVLAPDCLQLVRWFAEQGGAVLNCFSQSREWDLSRPNDVHFAINFCPWVWAFRANFFETILQPNWMRDPHGWDWSIKDIMQEHGIFAMQPALSRSGNVGKFSGINFTPLFHDQTFTGHVMSSGAHTDYRIVG